jgi:hypothetical protein
MLGLTRSERHNILVGLAFCAPFLLGFLGFTLYPMATSFYYSFTHYDGLNPPRWIGLTNYRFLFTEDDEFRQALDNTLYLVLVGVPAQLLTALVTALLLNVKIRGMAIYRTFYLLPAFLPIIPVAYLWQFMFNGDNGIVNLALGSIGLSGAGLVYRPIVGQAGLDSALHVDHRLHHDHLPGRAAGRTRTALRSGADRRRQQGPTVLAHHAADDLAGNALQPDHDHDRHVPDLRPGLRDQQCQQLQRRRAAGLTALLPDVPLEVRLQLPSLRLRVRHGLDPVHDHHALHARDAVPIEALGVLRR